MIKSRHFRLNWILINEIAIGPAPIKEKHLLIIKNEGIKSIFSLCGYDEAPFLDQMSDLFKCERFVLPDHKAGKIVTSQQILDALVILKNLKKEGPVFIHCVAAMERSPLICISWLIKMHELKLDEALNYLMQSHVGTNPLAEQLNVLKEEKFINTDI